MSSIKCVLLLVLCGSSTAQMKEEPQESRLCNTEKYAISCAAVPIAGHNVSVLGSLYPCARPIYMQFQVKKSNISKMSEYTFINPDETQKMRGWDQYLAFHVILKCSHKSAFIKAGFLGNSVAVYFIETKIDLPAPDECPNSGSSMSTVFPIVIVAVASLLIAGAASAFLLWWYKKRRRAKLQVNELLNNMETSPNSNPYQEEPISSEYDGLRPKTTTVIQNSVYRDSVNLDVALDPIPEEDGADCSSRSQRYHRRRQKHGSKTPRKEKRVSNGVNRNGYKRNNGDSDSLDSNSSDMSQGSGGADNNVNPADIISSVDGVDLVLSDKNDCNNQKFDNTAPLINTEDVVVTTGILVEGVSENVTKSNEINGLPEVSFS